MAYYNKMEELFAGLDSGLWTGLDSGLDFGINSGLSFEFDVLEFGTFCSKGLSLVNLVHLHCSLQAVNSTLLSCELASIHLLSFILDS